METNSHTHQHFAMFEAPDLPPVLAIEETAKGWRGLTAEGEVLNVESANGHPIPMPEGSIAVTRDGRPVGYRTLPSKPTPGTIDGYTRCFDAALRSMRANRLVLALTSIETALSFAPTVAGRFNRAMILLSLGRWAEGLQEFEWCEQQPLFMRPQYREALEHGLKPWMGEDLCGRRLLLIHDHGFGDTIMMLRYVPMLRSMGIDVVMMLPPELRRLGVQLSAVTANSFRMLQADCFCSFLFLLRHLNQTPKTIPVAPYLQVNPLIAEKWSRVIDKRQHTVGVAWTPGKCSAEDYQRAVPLAQVTKAFGKNVRLVSVQQQGNAEADMLGVEHYQFEDFADCAGLMSVCDEIITVDTAAVHLAGAIGHPRINLLLSKWSSWRWLSPLYSNIHVLRSRDEGDWSEALSRLHA